MVSAIYAQIGVNLTWRSGLSDCGFQIRWAEHSSYPSRAGAALAAARPFGSADNSITIYEVPLQRFLTRYANAPETVLAYVLAHELAHAMQGVDRHSGSGILKASWSYGEYYKMLSHRLAFTAKDVDLIRAGLAAKRARGPLAYARGSEDVGRR